MERFRILLMISVVMATSYGIGLVVWPKSLMLLYGIQLEPGGILLAQMLGAYLFGYATISWHARHAKDARLLYGIIIADFIADAGALLAALYGMYTHTLNAMGWEIVVINGLFSLAFGYFLFNPPLPLHADS